MQRDKIDRIREILRSAKSERGERPPLRLIRREDLAREIPEEDPIMREHRIARIRWLSKHYGLDVIIRRHTFGRAGMDVLNADELVTLHKEVERAFECVMDGFPIDEAGFIRQQGEP